MLEIKDLSVQYGKQAPTIEHFNLSMKKGEIISVVGESGSGKTTVIRAALGALAGGGRVSTGDIQFHGHSLLSNTKDEWRNLRGTRISMIFQDCGGTLNPIRKIGSQYVEYICTHTDIKLVMGIGREYNGISHLQKSFTEASRCVILSEKIQLNGSVFWYEEMGIYNLFSEFGDKKLIQDFVDSTLGIIIDYDKENNTNLLQTLKAYLWNNNSLLHASEQLFTHRNTVKYRIQRITELTGRNFDDAMTRLEFMNALICLEVR